MKKQTKNLIAILAIAIIVIVIVFFLIKGCTKKYTVDFDSMGGTLVSSLQIERDGTITKPADPIKDGYIFDGWYLNGEKFDFNTKITSDLKLEAHWVVAEGNGISLNSTSKELGIDETFKLAALLKGDIKNSKLVYTSSDDNIATVDENGNIKALKPGKITIIVKTADGKYSASCEVTVSDQKVLVSSIKITGKATMNVGTSQKLKLTIKPTNATNKDVTWSTSNKKIATVDKNGNVKALKTGKVTITATAKDDSKKKATYTITVVAAPAKPKEEEKTDVKVTDVKVNSITISGNNTMKYGSSQTLTATVKPDNASNKAVTWSVSSGASIDQNGRITITGDVDHVTVTATAQDGSGVSANYTITVEAIYAITLRAIDMGGDIFQNYSYTITRNGKPFTGYDELYVNGNRIWSSVSIAKSIGQEGNNASIVVNGKTITISSYTRHDL